MFQLGRKRTKALGQAGVAPSEGDLPEETAVALPSGFAPPRANAQTIAGIGPLNSAAKQARKQMELETRGKTALITGASGGLGAHFAATLARSGAEVVLGARRMEKLDGVVTGLRAQGLRARAVSLDVTDAGSIERLFADESFDIVVNNAGISGAGMALDLSPEGFDEVMATNLRGSFLVAQAAAGRMRVENRGGSIVNIASITGLRVAGAIAAYAASKAAVIQMTKALALEWARYGIRVNALCPGYIETSINAEFFTSPAGQALITRIPARRLGRAEELDGALLLLASQAGSFITGTTLAVDGGHLVSSL